MLFKQEQFKSNFKKVLSKIFAALLMSSLVEIHAVENQSRDNGCGLTLSNFRISDRIIFLEDQKHGLQTGDSFFRHYVMQYLSFGRFQTPVYLPPISKSNLDKASVVVAAFHGLNATISHAGSSLAFVNDLISEDRIYAEVIDQPGCGNNENFSIFDSLKDTIDFYASYLKNLKARANGKPLIGIGFCYSSGFLIEVNKRNPGLLDGMVLTGLIISDHKMGLDYAIDIETKMYQQGLIIENSAVRRRADRIYGELKWSSENNPFGQTPTLILIGENDPFMTAEARDHYRQLAVLNPNHVKFFEVKGGAHGVLGPIKDNPQSTADVRANIMELIQKALARARA